MELVRGDESMELVNNINLEPEIAKLLNEFLEETKGRTMAEMLPVLSRFKSRLPKDRVFSNEQKNQIIEAALNNMPDNEKNKYKALLKTLRII